MPNEFREKVFDSQTCSRSPSTQRARSVQAKNALTSWEVADGLIVWKNIKAIRYRYLCGSEPSGCVEEDKRYCAFQRIGGHVRAVLAREKGSAETAFDRYLAGAHGRDSSGHRESTIEIKRQFGLRVSWLRYNECEVGALHRDEFDAAREAAVHQLRQVRERDEHPARELCHLGSTGIFLHHGQRRLQEGLGVRHLQGQARQRLWLQLSDAHRWWLMWLDSMTKIFIFLFQ